MKRTHLTFAAVAAALLAVSPALAAQEQPKNLDATRSGVEKVDENRMPDSVRERLEEFRRQSAEHRDAAIKAAQELIARLRVAADRAGDRLSGMSEEAKREWSEIRIAVRKNLEEAESNLAELRTVAAEKWNETRSAVADALERAANALQDNENKDRS